jgi:serine/threonine-protein kinase
MAAELEAGAYVTPSVRLLHPLAQGGMGKVWVAEHLVLHTKVAVKLMSKEIEGVSTAAARFAKEAAIAAAVKSPHVVQVFDSGVTEEGVAFIVMELLEGHDLGAHLAARGRMAPAEVATVITQLGKALAKANRVGVVHRDLKPENVFLCDVEGGEPFVKLLDFGTAKDDTHAPSTTTAGQLLGTPYYMSPEQILGEAVDARSDIWSLGVVTFEALTGARPFEGVTVGAITLAIHTTNPRPSEIVPELPAMLDGWFARACARAPADRFQTARAAADALARAITGEAPLPEIAPTAPESEPAAVDRVVAPSAATSLSSTLVSPRAGERRMMTWLAAGVAVAALGAMILLLTNGGRATPPTGTASAALSASAAPSAQAALSASSAPTAQAAPGASSAPSVQAVLSASSAPSPQAVPGALTAPPTSTTLSGPTSLAAPASSAPAAAKVTVSPSASSLVPIPPSSASASSASASSASASPSAAPLAPALPDASASPTIPDAAPPSSAGPVPTPAPPASTPSFGPQESAPPPATTSAAPSRPTEIPAALPAPDSPRTP